MFSGLLKKHYLLIHVHNYIFLCKKCINFESIFLHLSMIHRLKFKTLLTIVLLAAINHNNIIIIV